MLTITSDTDDTTDIVSAAITLHEGCLSVRLRRRLAHGALNTTRNTHETRGAHPSFMSSSSVSRADLRAINLSFSNWDQTNGGLL